MGEFFSSKIVVFVKFVKDVDVVFGVFVLGIFFEVFSSFFDFGSGIGKGGVINVFGDNFIENGEGVSGGINIVVGGVVGIGLFVEEGNKGFFRMVIVVVFGSGVVFGEEFDGGI